MLKKIFPIVLLAVFLTGCKATFTNLTPSQQVRNETGLYPVEVSLNTRRGTLRWDSIEPKIIVGGESYLMRPTLLMDNRFEGLVPVSDGINITSYRYQFDFLDNDFGEPTPNSFLSDEYELKILDE